MNNALREYDEVWAIDFEFHAPPGERPRPLCLVARELHTGRLISRWLFEQAALPPFEIGVKTLFVAYYASAELGCYLALGWPNPPRVLDLFIEFRNLTNGLSTLLGAGLLGAMAYFGLESIDAVEKEEMRQLAIRGGPYTKSEQQALLNYCQSDVDALAKLLPVMLPRIDMPRAVVRGRYMSAVARMEWTGIPIDIESLGLLRQHWSDLKDRLIQRIDRDFGVFDGRTFKASLWARYLAMHNIPWPRHDSGALVLDDDTFKRMARQFPDQVAPIREVRHTLGQLRLNDLAVGSDGRNRLLLSAFRSTTGRNQPSNSRFIFGPSCWFRSLIQPQHGRAVAYVDWSQQEHGIAAALSADENMMTAYLSGDPYLTFAKQAGAVPSDATKKSHPRQREQFKVCALAVQYGMGERSLAQSLGEPEFVARELLRLHRQTYPRYWHWSQGAVDHAMLFGWIQTVFGWRIHVGPDVNVRSLANFPCQANGAEMLRLACCLMTERGISVCAPVHDAVLVEGPVDDIEHVVAEAQRAMREASEIILGGGGFALRTDAEIVRWPNRYMDERGRLMWDTVRSILTEITCRRVML